MMIRKLTVMFLALLSLSVAAQEREESRDSIDVPAVSDAVVQAAVVAVPQQAVALTEPAVALRFGYLSYEAAFQAMPEYAQARRELGLLKLKYESEMRRVEKDFNEKYEDFLEGQRDFPPTILQKRQMELQELMSKNIAFKEESQRLLKQAEVEAYAPLHNRLAQLLRIIAEDRGLAFILNTDNYACPYINPSQGEDLNAIVKATLTK